MLEREIKLSFDTPDQARAAIAATGAVLLHGRRLQEDALLDSEDQDLRGRRCVLRVRTEWGKSLLTFKAPVQEGRMKVREEFETVVSDGDVLMRVLEELGLRVWFRYEKYREEYAADGVTIALDETPVGTYIEIEGTEPGILAVTHALGRTPADFILDSYRSLFVRHCRAEGLTDSHMLFREA
jgi:adenylate cyclase, class 2